MPTTIRRITLVPLQLGKRGDGSNNTVQIPTNMITCNKKTDLEHEIQTAFDLGADTSQLYIRDYDLLRAQFNAE